MKGKSTGAKARQTVHCNHGVIWTKVPEDNIEDRIFLAPSDG